ncbi:unnamed protein product [Allacma fusca]|uniref:Uncharacterized protein n=1 Tax=Allacma fusca TaxID=39272 RepID=A0A8J2P3G2_9HEXA|nr:unnamed protein product [Allacma fusca]
MCPNDYEKALKDLRERRDKEAEEEENKRKQEEIKSYIRIIVWKDAAQSLREYAPCLISIRKLLEGAS